MSKKVETTGTVEENLFEGFNFLNNPVPKETSKGTKTKEVESKVDTDDNDELSEEELAALEESSKEIQNKKASPKTTKKAVKEEVEESEESEETEETQEPDENEFAGFAKFLAEEGVIDVEGDEEVNSIKSERDLVKVVDKTIKLGIDKYKQSIPEDAQKFLEFVENGGRPADFHKYYYSDGSFEDFDISSDENKKYVIAEALKLEEYSDEEIEAEINDLEDLGKLDKKAQFYLSKLQKIEQKDKEALIEIQKNYAREQEKARAEEWENFRKGLFEKETVGGFKMTPKMKEDTWDYMTKIVDKKTGETQYQKDSKENPDARYLFAYLLKNKWDKSALERQVESKQVSKLRDKLSNYTDTRQKLKSPKSNIEREDDANPFSAFKNLK